MISVHAKEINGRWFGLACVGEEIVATAAGSTRDRVLENLGRSIPAGVRHRMVEESTEFAERTIGMLAELEAGHEENKRFSLALKQAWLRRTLQDPPRAPRHLQ
jgi:hypothetical protein